MTKTTEKPYPSGLHIPVADLNLELRGIGLDFVLLVLPAFLPSVIFSLFTQNKGCPGPLGSSLRSNTTVQTFMLKQT